MSETPAVQVASPLEKRFFSVLSRFMTAHPDWMLVVLSEREARFWSPKNRVVVVVWSNEGAEGLWLEGWLSQLQDHAQAPLEVLVISNDESVRQIQLKRKAPLYQINEAGELWMGEHTSNRSSIVSIARQEAETKSLDALDVPALRERANERFHQSHHSIKEMTQFETHFAKQPARAAWGLAGLMLVLFALEEWWGGSRYTPTLVRMGANGKSFILEGEYWRLLTSVFLHSGYLHIFVNTYVLFALGIFFNRLFGGARFFTLFLLSGFTGSLASYLIGGTAVSVGASGALWGLLGASAALIVRPSSLLPEILRARMKRLTLANLLINLAVSFMPSIDLWAHIGGGVGGFCVGLLYTHFASQGRQPLAYILLILLGFCFVMAGLKGQPWQLVRPMEFREVTIGEEGFSLKVPALLKKEMIEEKSAEYQMSFGELPRDPFLLHVKVYPFVQGHLSRSDQGQLLLAEFERLRVQSGYKYLELPRPIRSEGSISAFAKMGSGYGDQVWLWFQIQDKKLVQLEIQVMPQTPVRLLEELPLIFESLRPGYTNVVASGISQGQ